MPRTFIAGILALGLAACSGSAANEAADQGAGAGSPSVRTAPTERSIESGVRVEATIQDSLSSRINKAGETVRATVSADVKDSQGRVVIPAGSTVMLAIEHLDPGSDQVRPEGRLSLIVTSVNVNGEAYPITADLQPVAHRMVGRGVTKDEAERLGAGTVIGAVAGRVIGKSTKSTVIGGAIGAVAGGAVAARYAYRDVVVSAGTPIVFSLTQSLRISRK